MCVRLKFSSPTLLEIQPKKMYYIGSKKKGVRIGFTVKSSSPRLQLAGPWADV